MSDEPARLGEKLIAQVQDAQAWLNGGAVPTKDLTDPNDRARFNAQKKLIKDAIDAAVEAGEHPATTEGFLKLCGRLTLALELHSAQSSARMAQLTQEFRLLLVMVNEVVKFGEAP